MTDDEYATWDAPYVLGALDRAERLEYEEHLATCRPCRAAVAELAGLPSLLGRVEPAVALSLVDPQPEPLHERTNHRPEPVAPQPDSTPELLPRLVRRTDASRRRGRLAAAGAAVLAAAAAVAVAVPITVGVTHRDTPSVAATGQVVAERQLEPLAATAVSATVRIIDAGGRATVEMSCRYAPGSSPYQENFELWLTSRTGLTAELVGWTAGPGDDLTLTRTTDVPPDQIAAVEIRAKGATILRSAI
ncbi:anti-sigma factor family protein [Nocardia sp. NPDC004068]|uniref:anti-sigma factor family protein n=1 Tax=Nocardia sp. NPDC004068 TaxID=3364303 RepID=UPI0036C387FB